MSPDGSRPQIDPATVRVIALYEPTGTEPMGLLEAHTFPLNLLNLLAEFRRLSSQIGGTIAKIDEIKTSSHWETQTFSESYSCGTAQSPRTCSRMVTRQVEVYVTTMVGRAFR